MSSAEFSSFGCEDTCSKSSQRGRSHSAVERDFQGDVGCASWCPSCVRQQTQHSSSCVLKAPSPPRWKLVEQGKQSVLPVDDYLGPRDAAAGSFFEGGKVSGDKCLATSALSAENSSIQKGYCSPEQVAPTEVSPYAASFVYATMRSAATAAAKIVQTLAVGNGNTYINPKIRHLCAPTSSSNGVNTQQEFPLHNPRGVHQRLALGLHSQTGMGRAL